MRVSGLQVDEGTEVSTLQAILEAETGLSVEQQSVLHNGKQIPSRYIGAVQFCCPTVDVSGLLLQAVCFALQWHATGGTGERQ